MKVTLDEIRSYGPCQDRWEHGLQHADPLPADDEPFELARVLDVNGVADTLWLLGEMGEQQLLVRFACDCAERAVERYWAPHHPDDLTSQDAIEAARRWVESPTEENRRRADNAAEAVKAVRADVAAQRAARAAAVEDAEKAADHTAVAATYYADYYNADAAEEREWQTYHLRMMLEEAASAAAESKIWKYLLGYACDCAELAVARYPEDRRPREVIAAARRWAESPTAENRRKAHAAATQAAYCVAYEDAAESALAALAAAVAAARAHLAEDRT